MPTIFAGMVSPYAIRILVKNRESSGHDAGYLYFISTIGSSFGTLLTAFYLVLLFEVNTILMVAIGISVILGGLGSIGEFRERYLKSVSEVSPFLQRSCLSLSRVRRRARSSNCCIRSALCTATFS